MHLLVKTLYVIRMHLLVLLTALQCFSNVQKILKVKAISCFSIDGILLVCEVPCRLF